MSQAIRVRLGWLRFMYAYTIAGAGAFGLGILVAPDAMGSALRFPKEDPIVLGISGSVYSAFAILSLLGLRSPLKFVPVLLLQLCYKCIWFLCIVIPLGVSGHLPPYSVAPAVIFATYIIGDLIAIPFRYVFAKDLPLEGQP